MPDQSAKPYPYGVWVSISLAGLELTTAQRITTELLSLHGRHTYHAYQNGSNRMALRYTYAPGRCVRYVARATTLLKGAGVRRPTVTAFEIWRTTFRLADALDFGQYSALAMNIKGLRQVFETSSNETRSMLVVDFKGMPGAGVMQAVHGYIAPHLP